MQKNSLHALLDFLSPTKTESILYVFAGLILIFAAKTTSLFDSLTVNVGAHDEIERVWLGLVDKMNNYSDVSGAFFWFLAGAILYLIIWITAVILIDWYNDVLVSTSFIHPRSFHQSEYWTAIVGRFFIRVASGILLAALIMITFGTFIVSGYSTALEAWNSSLLSMLGSFSIIIIVAAAVSYSSTLLVRLIFLRRRLYS